MPGRPFMLVDVFTARPLEGNGLSVVHDADGVADATMHRFARETRQSETSFVQSAGAGGADYRHRIFMMSGEIPFAGHPSLGTAAAVARRRGERAARYVQETRAGLQPIEVELHDRVARVGMLQEPPAFGPELDPGEVLAMAGLDAGDADPGLPVQVVSTGVNQVVAPIADPARLAAVRPDFARIGPLLAAHDAVVLYVAWVDPEAGRARARSFAGTAEMGEDPATGAAAGPLCAHVQARGGPAALTIGQGIEMGRPSELRARIEGDRVRVEGDAVILAEGTVHLDLDI